MLKNRILISKDEILTKYINLNEKVKFIIEKLYDDSIDEHELKLFNITIKKIRLSDMIKLNIQNSYKNLEFVKKKTGVYLFLDKDENPVYIGFGGRGKKEDLKERIKKHFSGNESVSKLITNIKEIENYLNNTNLEDTEFKNILLDYTPFLIVIDCGDMYKNKISMEKNEDNVKFAQALEVILIALFNSKYNK